MESIYSRKRIRLPKVVYQKFGKKEQGKKISKFLLIVGIMLITFLSILRVVVPVFEKTCEDKAKSIATLICNAESTKIIEKYQYDDLVTIYKDKNENITMIKSNVIPINLVISDVAENIQKSIENTKGEKIKIRLGSFTGSRLLSGLGPEIPIRLSTMGNVETDLRSEFKSAGINQTIHRIYLQVDCKISIITPYRTVQENISNQVLIAENVIVGKIPETYYNIEGVDKQNAIDLIE